MFTAVTIIAVVVAWRYKDRVDNTRRDDMALPLVRTLHGREDARLMAFLLFAILIMLGVIADILMLRPNI